MPLSRRTCLGLLGASLAAPAWADAAQDGRLTARPGASPPIAARFGYVPLGLDSPQRDAWLYTPKAASAGTPMPLLVMLHGSGDSARGIAEEIAPQAEARGFALLAPKSRGATWDLHHAPACDDAAFVDKALARTFAMLRTDPARIAIGGMSDGASFALSLGVTNGDLFSDVIAFSGGYLRFAGIAGHPRIFISHGQADRIIPFKLGRRIADTLTADGLDVTFREFDGGHEIPSEGLRAALDRFLK